MMLGVEDYGSDAESDGERPQTPAGSSSLVLPKPKRAPKKITIALPDVNGDEEEGRPSKKPRTESGAGASTLFSMLPAPKQAAAPKKVLGAGRGPGLVFNESRPSAPPPSTVTPPSEEVEIRPPPPDDMSTAPAAPPTLFRPASLGARRGNVSLETPKPSTPAIPPPKVSAAPAIDFFSLGSNSTTTPSITPSDPPKGASSISLPVRSSAPKIEEFVPPEPTPNDEYPGYYRIPSGAWAAYDPDYYRKFYNKWQAEYNAHVRALEKGMVKGFEGLETTGAQDVNAQEEMERAKKDIQEREERKAVTHGAEGGLKAPRMNIQGAKLGGRARSRHQLTTLLTEAYQNREALEDRIAEGRRNRKEAGNKYGF